MKVSEVKKQILTNKFVLEDNSNWNLKRIAI